MHLYNRTVSAIPVSIGTSLALESLFKGSQPTYDPARKAPPKISLQPYQEIWINVSTLLRNISHATDRETYFDCVPSHILEILNTEIEIIQSVFQNEGHGLVKPVFFFCSYKSLRAAYKGKVEFRQSTTVIQKSFDFKAERVLKDLVRQTDQIYELDSELKPQGYHNALIMTHYPYDLTSYRNFRQLDLLESHTGILKTKVAWNTKYADFGKESLHHLPFHKELLMIFGDKSLIEPASRKTRQMVLDISRKEKWTPVTTVTKIHDSYRKHVSHPADLSVLLSF